MAADIFKHGIGDTNQLQQKAFDTYNADYHKAVDSVEIDSEQQKLFKNNMSRLAAAKATVLSTDLDRARADFNGVVRSKQDYMKAANKIINAHNRSQAAEFNTAVHRCRVAKQWATFEKERNLYPCVEWIRSRSAHPRERHLQYAGRVWKMNDPFLQEEQPGCLYNCKCSWRSTDAEPTDNSNLTRVAPDKGLEGNPYYTGELFTEQHPYFTNVAKHIPDLGVLHNADDVVYLNKYENDFKYQIHFNARKEFETVNKQYLTYIQKAGFTEVKFLPTIEHTETELRKRYFGKYWESKKCADFKTGTDFVELKTALAGKKMRRNIVDHIGDAVKKADIVLIKIGNDLGYAELKQLALSQFGKYNNLKRIVFAYGDDTIYNYVR